MYAGFSSQFKIFNTSDFFSHRFLNQNRRQKTLIFPPNKKKLCRYYIATNKKHQVPERDLHPAIDVSHAGLSLVTPGL
jgi:hypothetical protein